MHARKIKKGLGLLVIDFAIIIGIFVLQFRNDSIINIKSGNLQFTLTETMDENNNPVMKDRLQLSFSGISFYTDEAYPAYIRKAGSIEKEKIPFTGWKKNSDLDYSFTFGDDVNVDFIMSDTTENAVFSLVARMPEEYEEFYLPYKLPVNFEEEESGSGRKVLTNKKGTWTFEANEITNDYVGFTRLMNLLSFDVYTETVKTFTFDTVNELAPTASSAYVVALSSFKENLIAAYKSANESNVTEQALVSYVAAMSERGRYNQALDDIPQSMRKAVKRTYLSAPYFGSLSSLNDNLSEEIAKKDELIRKAYTASRLDFLTERDIAHFMYINPATSTVKVILQSIGRLDAETLTIAQITGLLRLYTEMVPLSKNFARHLEPAIPKALEVLEKACKLENDVLTISENGTFLSVLQAIEVGDALIRYGELVGNQNLVQSGKFLVSSYMAESSSFDFRTLGEIYPILVHNNNYYPHFKKIYTQDNDVVWAWTVANDITYEKDSSGNITYFIDFPEGSTHYVIFRGVKSFRSIYIYNMAFRMAQDFEIYNSSGYVYKADTLSLLLKSRQKVSNEEIRLIYAAPRPAPAPAAEETTTTETTETTSE